MSTRDAQQQDWLDTTLARHAEYIADEGFTARVMASLPAPRRSRLRTPVLLASTALACLLAFVAFPGAACLVQAVHDVVAKEAWKGTVPFAALAIVLMIVWGGAAAVVSAARADEGPW